MEGTEALRDYVFRLFELIGGFVFETIDAFHAAPFVSYNLSHCSTQINTPLLISYPLHSY